MGDSKFSPHKGVATNETLSVRMLMDGKEVGSIIGNKGETVKRMREESGSKIFISAGGSPERIVTITGNIDTIYKAFQLICINIEEAQERRGGDFRGGSRDKLSVKLIVPSSQCGSIIGKGGAKVKEIRELSGANVMVSNDLLPDCTERSVSISGSVESIAQCVYHVGVVMLEAPPKGSVVPYRPRDGGPGGPPAGPPGPRGPRGALGPMFDVEMGAGFGRMGGPDAFDGGRFEERRDQNPLANLLSAMQGGGAAAPAPPQNPLQAGTSAITALAALAGSQLRQPRNAASSGNQQTHEITVPNELIGCILGRRGSKIAEIRQMTGAMITITKFDSDNEESTSQERIIRIKGTSDQVALAQYLINTSVEMHKANLEGNQEETEEGSGGLNPNAIPLANLLKNPAALNALSSITNINLNSLGGLQELLAGDGSASMSGGGGGGRQSFQPRMRAPPGGSSPPREQRRDRFQPY